MKFIYFITSLTIYPFISFATMHIIDEFSHHHILTNQMVIKFLEDASRETLYFQTTEFFLNHEITIYRATLTNSYCLCVECFANNDIVVNLEQKDAEKSTILRVIPLTNKFEKKELFSLAAYMKNRIENKR